MRHDEIVEEISRLSETTANLKKQLDKPKSKLDSFKEYAGVVSLLLSLATGFFAIYTSFFTEPAKSRAEAQGKLHDVLAQIVTLDQEYMHELQQNDPTANNGALEWRRNILLQQAEDLAHRSGVASAEDQVSLGNSYVFGGRYELGLAHFKAALKAVDPVTKASAETQIGKLELYGISGTTPQQGRLSFDDAERLLTDSDSRQGRIALMQAISIRSLAECSVGDPALGQQARLRAQEKLMLLARDAAISPQLIDTYRTGLVTGFSNTHCTDPLSGVSMPTKGIAPPVSSPSVSSVSNKIDLSNQMLHLLVAHDYAGLEVNMTATAQSQVPESRLRSIWEQISAVTGPYQRTINTKTNVVNNITYYIVHAQCEKGLVALALAYDGANRISFILITPLSSLPKTEIESRAVKVANDFFQQNFAGIVAGFDVNLRSQLTASQLQSFFMQVTNASGHYQRIVEARKDGILDFVDVLCQLEAGRAVIRVAYDPDMKINGFVIVPGK